ncbi:MAG: thioredoxin domain-containing protein [Thalassolituus sp.]
MALDSVNPDALAEILNTHQGAVLVEITREHCAPCKALETLIRRYQSLFPPGTLVLSISADMHPRWCDSVGVRSAPALMLALQGELSWLKGDISVSGVQRFLQSGLNIMFNDADAEAEILMERGDLAGLGELLSGLRDEDSRTSVLQRAKSLLSMRNMTLTGVEAEIHQQFFAEAAEQGWQRALDTLSDALVRFSGDEGVRSLAIALGDVVPDRSLVQRWRRSFCGC